MWGGGGVSCPGQFILPPPTWVSKENYFAKFSHFKLSECDDVSIINIIQVKFSCFFVRLFCMRSCRGGGKLSRTVYLAPTHLGIKVKSLR